MEGRLSLKLKSGYALASTHKILLLFTSISSHPSLQHFYPRDVVRGIFATATWLAGWLGGWVCVCHSRYCIKTTKRILLLQRVRRLIARIQRFDDEIDKFRYKKNMADSRHFENRYTSVSEPRIDHSWRNTVHKHKFWHSRGNYDRHNSEISIKRANIILKKKKKKIVCVKCVRSH